jgi:branched-chain amino acid transport system permease protein
MLAVDRLPGRVSGRALLGFLVAMAALPWLLPNQYLVHIFVVAGVYVTMAMGLNLLMGYAGQVSLGHAGFYGLGAYISAVLSVRFGISPWLGMPVAAAATGALAYVLGIPTLRLKSYYLAMATLGIGVVLHLAFVQLYPVTGGSSGLSGILPWDIGPIHFTTATHHYLLVWAFAGAALWMARNLVNSRVGRVLRALGESEVAAEAMGVDTAAEKRRVFVLSAVYASVAGSLYAHYITVISPEIFSFLFSVVLVLMVALGGIGLYWGAVIGAFLLTVLPEALRRFGDWELPLYGLTLILVMLFLPRGIAGVLVRARAAGTPAGAVSVTASSGRHVSTRGARLLEVRGITKWFGGVRAVHDCSFDVTEGQIKAVIGPNGAGKTTLFNVITGVYAPTEGEFQFRERRWPASPRIGSRASASPGPSRTSSSSRVSPSSRTSWSAASAMRRRASSAQPLRCLRSHGRAAPISSARSAPSPRWGWMESGSTARAACPSASKSWSRWRGPLPRSPRSSSSTSPRRGSTRARRSR